MHHTLSAARDNLHANFTRDPAPVLTIDSGDTVTLTNIPDVGWGLEPPTSLTAPRRKVEPRDPVSDPSRDAGPCMIGPIAIRGARPGDALEITIDRVTTASWGWTYAGAGMAKRPWNTALGLADAPLTLMRWSIDSPDHATNHLGHAVATRPFPGVLGLAPVPDPADSYASGWTPRICGGNMDCRELTAGSTLWLPVMIDGAMLSTGDGHAAQGDGEVSGTAIETMLNELRLTVTLHRATRLPCPRIFTAPDREGTRRWITLGFGQTLDDAAAMAMSGMLDLMQSQLNLPRPECLALASARVSLRITQTVNPAKGVHAVLE